MVYWNGPQGTFDNTFSSPFDHGKGEDGKPKKYVTFEKDRAGWNNGRMNTESVMIMAYVAPCRASEAKPGEQRSDEYYCYAEEPHEMRKAELRSEATSIIATLSSPTRSERRKIEERSDDDFHAIPRRFASSLHSSSLRPSSLRSSFGRSATSATLSSPTTRGLGRSARCYHSFVLQLIFPFITINRYALDRILVMPPKQGTAHLKGNLKKYNNYFHFDVEEFRKHPTIISMEDFLAEHAKGESESALKKSINDWATGRKSGISPDGLRKCGVECTDTR